MYDITAIGTALIDFTPIEVNGVVLYEPNPGGSVANFLVSASRMGAVTAILAKVGKDRFGSLLKSTLEESGVDTSSFILDGEYNTPVSFVTLAPSGERSFAFYSDNMADSHLREIDYSLLDNTKILDTSSFILSGDESYTSVIKTADYMREKKRLIAFDINWRERIWKGDIEKGRERVLSLVKRSDIVKASIEELEFITGCSSHNVEKGAEALLVMGPRMVAVTYGEDGSEVFTSKMRVFEKAFPVHAVDTTGAGDCFWAVFLSTLLKNKCGILSLNESEIRRALKRANKAASLSVTKRGGIPSMPYLSEIGDEI